MISQKLAAATLAVLFTAHSYGATIDTPAPNITRPGPGQGGKRTPYLSRDSKSIIYSNFATKYRENLWWPGGAYPVSGPSGFLLGYANYVAGGFTPTKNATATKVKLSLGTSSGSPQYTIGIFADENGVPGKVLWSTTAIASVDSYTCCVPAIVTIKQGLPLTAGTPYWLGVTLATQPENDGDMEWTLAETNEQDGMPVSDNIRGQGWNSSIQPNGPAFAVFGD